MHREGPCLHVMAILGAMEAKHVVLGETTMLLKPVVTVKDPLVRASAPSGRILGAVSTAYEGPGHPEERPRYSSQPASEKPERPSMLQTLAGALTAITVTYLMSFLGVAGTVIGVGLVSVLTVVGNFMYSSAIHSAKEKVKHTQTKAGQRAARAGSVDVGRSARQSEEFSAVVTPDESGYAVKPDGRGSTSNASADTDVMSAEPAGPARGEPAPASSDSPEESAPSGRWRRAWNTMIRRYGAGKIIGSVVLVFALLAGTVTVIELSAGQPLSDIVRNEDSGGTTFFGGTGGEGDGAEIEDDDTGEVPPPEEDGPVDEPPAPEAPQEDDLQDPAVPEGPQEENQGPVEEPQQED